MGNLYNNCLTAELISEYHLCQKQFNIACMIMLKFSTTGDWSILPKALQYLSNQYIKEIKVLLRFYRKQRII